MSSQGFLDLLVGLSAMPPAATTSNPASRQPLSDNFRQPHVPVGYAEMVPPVPQATLAMPSNLSLFHCVNAMQTHSASAAIPMGYYNSMSPRKLALNGFQMNSPTKAAQHLQYLLSTPHNGSSSMDADFHDYVNQMLRRRVESIGNLGVSSQVPHFPVPSRISPHKTVHIASSSPKKNIPSDTVPNGYVPNSASSLTSAHSPMDLSISAPRSISTCQSSPTKVNTIATANTIVELLSNSVSPSFQAPAPLPAPSQQQKNNRKRLFAENMNDGNSRPDFLLVKPLQPSVSKKPRQQQPTKPNHISMDTKLYLQRKFQPTFTAYPQLPPLTADMEDPSEVISSAWSSVAALPVAEMRKLDFVLQTNKYSNADLHCNSSTTSFTSPTKDIPVSEDRELAAALARLQEPVDKLRLNLDSWEESLTIQDLSTVLTSSASSSLCCHSCGKVLLEEDACFLVNVPLRSPHGMEVYLCKEMKGRCKPGKKSPEHPPDEPANRDHLRFCRETCYQKFVRNLEVAQARLLWRKKKYSQEEKATRQELSSLVNDTVLECYPVNEQSSTLFLLHQGVTSCNEFDADKTPLPCLTAFWWKRQQQSQEEDKGVSTLKRRAIYNKANYLWRNKRWKQLKGKEFAAICEKFRQKKKRLSNTSDQSEAAVDEWNSPAMSLTGVEEDTRQCTLCHLPGDQAEDGPGRLLCYDAERWLHINCALWCLDVYETQGGAICGLMTHMTRALNLKCALCKKVGAGVQCYAESCTRHYHLACAKTAGCVFTEDRGMYCSRHVDEANCALLQSLAVLRRVYLERPELEQVAGIVIRLSEEDEQTVDRQVVLRLGACILHSVGQLLPHQVHNELFHTRDYIYPVGYRAYRYYWSCRRANHRAVYECSIEENKVTGAPVFRVVVRENTEEPLVLEGADCTTVWRDIMSQVIGLRLASRQHHHRTTPSHLLSQHLVGEQFFGLTEPHIVRAVESLTGTEILRDYAFKFGRRELIANMPTPVNPSGCARAEGKREKFVAKSLRHAGELHHSAVQRTACSSRFQLSVSELMLNLNPTFDDLTPSNGHTKVSSSVTNNRPRQYRRLQNEVHENAHLRRSGIQGLGLYAARPLERHSLIIEYIGELIRTEVANLREKMYERQQRGIYMFRLNDDFIVDATVSGGMARYVNHSCAPNCVAQIIQVDGVSHIVIVAGRDISTGEELTYDYKFDIEDSSQGIPCLCGAPNCRKWMNG